MRDFLFLHTSQSRRIISAEPFVMPELPQPGNSGEVKDLRLSLVSE